MEMSDSDTNSGAKEIWVSSESFARYAETDLDRWRQLIGRQVQHTDSRWGTGVVESISWGSPCGHVPSYVQIRICYEAGWTVVVHSETWHQHHQQVSIPVQIEAVIRHCLDPALSEEDQAECLAKHSRELREQRDRETLDRAAKARQQASGDDETIVGSES